MNGHLAGRYVDDHWSAELAATMNNDQNSI